MESLEWNGTLNRCRALTESNVLEDRVVWVPEGVEGRESGCVEG